MNSLLVVLTFFIAISPVFLGVSSANRRASCDSDAWFWKNTMAPIHQGFFLIALVSHAIALDGDDIARCNSLGFGANLMCPSCSKLAPIDGEFERDCLSCCENVAESITRATHARLEVCK
jgi:hypothetical protein